ncbi:hypothetical protein [Kitasatospora sp. NPDC091207]|uniref:hypothetical protein n=1 Tax=Kitasatospora sp. NPDC091207 TaxID=3364083 RepID=UPI003804908C
MTPPVPTFDDGQADYRDAVERRRRGIQDSQRRTAAFAVSMAGLVVLAAMLLTVCRPHN